MPVIKIKKTLESAKIPTGKMESAGYDLYSINNEPVSIQPGETKQFDTGIAMAIPDGYWGGIYARSGIATNKGLRPANCTGVIDPDYRGNIKVALHNDTDKIQTVNPHSRIAQIVFHKREVAHFTEVGTLDDTERGASGFGSTGE